MNSFVQWVLHTAPEQFASLRAAVSVAYTANPGIDQPLLSRTDPNRDVDVVLARVLPENHHEDLTRALSLYSSNHMPHPDVLAARRARKPY